MSHVGFWRFAGGEGRVMNKRRKAEGGEENLI
jgi:hypothetical protein